MCSRSRDDVNEVNETGIVTRILGFLESSENLQNSCGSLTPWCLLCQVLYQDYVYSKLFCYDCQTDSLLRSQHKLITQNLHSKNCESITNLTPKSGHNLHLSPTTGLVYFSAMEMYWTVPSLSRMCNHLMAELSNMRKRGKRTVEVQSLALWACNKYFGAL